MKNYLFNYSRLVFLSGEKPNGKLMPDEHQSENGKKVEKLKKQARELAEDISSLVDPIEKVEFLFAKKLIDKKTYANAKLFFQREQAGFNKTIDGQQINIPFQTIIDDNLAGISKWSAELNTELNTKNPKEKNYLEEKANWKELASFLHKDIQQKADWSLKTQAYFSAYGFRKIQNKMLEEINRKYPGFNEGFNATGAKVDRKKAKKLTDYLNNEIKKQLDADNVKNILTYWPDLKNGELDLDNLFKDQGIENIFTDFKKVGGDYLKQFENEDPDKQPPFIIPGSTRYSEAEEDNIGELEEDAGFEVPDVLAPGMDKKLEDQENNNFLFQVKPPLPENVNFKTGVYNEFNQKGLSYLDNKPFDQGGITQNKDGAPEFTLTGYAKKGGSYLIPVPYGFAVSSVDSPHGATIKKNSNRVYQIDTLENSEIILKIFESNDELKDTPTDEEKNDFLGDFKGKPGFGGIDIQQSTPDKILSMAQKIQGYIQENTLYETDSILAKNAVNYNNSKPNFFAGLEDRRYFSSSNKQMMLADSEISNMYFVGLCRSAGIPARIVKGFSAKEKVEFSPSKAWAEIWDGKKWVQIDASPTQQLPKEQRDYEIAYAARMKKFKEQTAAEYLAWRKEQAKEGIKNPQMTADEKTKFINKMIDKYKGSLSDLKKQTGEYMTPEEEREEANKERKQKFLEKLGRETIDNIAQDFKDLIGRDNKGDPTEPGLTMEEFINKNKDGLPEMAQLLALATVTDEPKIIQEFLKKYDKNPEAGKEFLGMIEEQLKLLYNDPDINKEEIDKALAAIKKRLG